jgi:hypothetical protein
MEGLEAMMSCIPAKKERESEAFRTSFIAENFYISLFNWKTAASAVWQFSSFNVFIFLPLKKVYMSIHFSLLTTHVKRSKTLKMAI